jgi:hypothetical protein
MTIYDTQTNIVPHDEVCSTATTMAGDGYIVAADGGDDTDNYILIGMRVQGEAYPVQLRALHTRGHPISPLSSISALQVTFAPSTSDDSSSVPAPKVAGF